MWCCGVWWEGGGRADALFSGAQDGKDAIELLETTVDYFRTANAEDPARAEKQKSLARQYEGILQKTKDKLAGSFPPSFVPGRAWRVELRLWCV